LAAVVVDASIVVDFLLDEDRAAPMEHLLLSPDEDLWVPAVSDVEVTAAIRRTFLSGHLSLKHAVALIESYLDLPIERHGHEGLLPRMFELAENFTSYDAAYVALAERLDNRLITSDNRLARAVAAHTRVTLVDNME
jgi:predicted nucleic acid-binding protein